MRQEVQKSVWKGLLRTFHVPNRFLHLLSPWRIFSTYFLKILLVGGMKRLKTSSRGLEWRFRKFEQGPRFRKKSSALKCQR
jgi:hypothetical protein